MQKYLMQPDDLNKAARELLDLASDVDQNLSNLTRDILRFGTDFNSAEITSAQKLVEASDEWRSIRIRRLHKRIERLGMFLAAHAAEQVSMDEFSASDFNGVVDPDMFPESKPDNNPPAGGSDQPQPMEEQ